MNVATRLILLFLTWSVVCFSASRSVTTCRASDGPSFSPLGWPTISREQKPWTRWWWFGAAVDPKNLEAELDRFSKAGLGGVEITCLYDAKGYEDRHIRYLSERWINMFNTTTELARRFDLGIDLPPSSGWVYGGPHVSPEQTTVYASLETKSLESEGACRFDLTDRRLAAVMAYSEDGAAVDLRQHLGEDHLLRWQAPPGRWTVYLVTMKPSPQRNHNFLAGREGWAVDPLDRHALSEYLADWTSRARDMRLEAVRAFHHDSFEYDCNFSPDLFNEFSHRRGYDLRHHLPALFGRASEDPSLRIDSVARVRSDYRQTVSDMHREHFLEPLTTWAHQHGSRSRNQAHGAPGNLLDLYAAVDIPDAELYGRVDQPGPPENPFTDSMSVKMASSAAHVAGRRLISAESCTWLEEHFHTTLADMKQIIDRFFLGGVNHICYHGSAYSPADVPWPGWLFYATTQVNSRNSTWRDLPALNRYIARCQSILQSGTPAGDVLLYWPIHDLWQVGHDLWWQDVRGYYKQQRYKLPELPLLDANWGGTGYMQFPLHVKQYWLDSQPAGRVASRLWERGYGFDFISDRLLQTCIPAQQNIQSPGARYRVIVVPAARVMPLATLQKLFELARNGSTVVFVSHLPEDVPGLLKVNERLERQRQLLSSLPWSDTDSPSVRKAILGKGQCLLGSDVDRLLTATGLPRETLVDQRGLQFIRRKHSGGHHYFLKHSGEQPLDAWLTPAVNFQGAVLLDPMSGASGLATTRIQPGKDPQVRVQLQPDQALVLRTLLTPAEGVRWPYHEPAGNVSEIRGNWSVQFITGGPTLPASFQTPALASWTRLGGADAQRFAGTARYTITFDAPARENTYLLDLGSVRDSARVRLNDRAAGTLINPPFRVLLKGLRRTENRLEIEVTNVAANRIRDLDLRKQPWMGDHVAHARGYGVLNIGTTTNRQLDADKWPLRDAGLLGPVTLQPHRE